MAVEDIRVKTNETIDLGNQALLAQQQRDAARARFGEFLLHVQEVTNGFAAEIRNVWEDKIDDSTSYGKYPEILDAIDQIGSGNPKVAQARADFEKAEDHAGGDWSNIGSTLGDCYPLNKIYQTLLRTAEHAGQLAGATMESATTVPGSDAANAVALLQSGIAHLEDYRDTDL
jgi:hypothetical protein